MPGQLQAVRKLVGEVMGRAGVDSRTRLQKNDLWASYVAENTGAVMASPEVSAWRGILAGVPALIIGAGPSLTESLPQITACQDRMLLLGAASILGPLAKARLSPHCVTALEAKDESRQFVGPGNGKGAAGRGIQFPTKPFPALAGPGRSLSSSALGGPGLWRHGPAQRRPRHQRRVHSGPAVGMRSHHPCGPGFGLQWRHGPRGWPGGRRGTTEFINRWPFRQSAEAP